VNAALERKLEEKRLQRAQAAGQLAAPKDPGTAGRVFELSQRTRLPAETVERNLPEVEEREAVRALPWDEIAQSAELQRYLADPQRAAVVRDDVPQMLSFRRALLPGGPVQALPQAPAAPEPGLFEVVGNRFESGRRGAFEIPAAAAPLMWGALTGSPVSFEQRRTWQELRARELGPTRRAGIMDDILGAPLEQLPILASIGGSALAGGVAGGAGGAVVGGIGGALAGGVGAVPGAVAGAATGFTLGLKPGSAAGAFLLESGNAFAEFSDLTDAAGQPLPEDAVAAAAVTVGAINAGLEFAGFQSIAKRIPGVNRLVGRGADLAKETVKRQLANPVLRQQLIAAAREVLKAVGTEIGTELAQEAVNIEAGRVLDPQREIGLDVADVERLSETAVQTAFGVLPLVGVGQTVQVKLDRVAQAQQNAAQLQLAAEAVAQAKTREISPQAFGELTEALAREAGIEDVRIPAAVLAASPELLAQMPEVASQIPEAMATGGDVRVSVGRYFGTLAPALPDLVQDVRLRPEDLTLREAQATEAELPAQMDQEVALAAAVAEAATKVQIQGDGFTKPIRNAAGDQVGVINGAVGDFEGVPALKIEHSHIDSQEDRGSGHGLRAYMELIQQAAEEGRVVFSDADVSPAADRIYQALEHRGYTVIKDPVAVQRADGGWSIPRGLPARPVYRVAPPEGAATVLSATAPVQAPQSWAVEAIRNAKTRKAAEEVIAVLRAQDQLGLSAPLFTDPAGVLTGDEFAQYQAALEGARSKARAKLSQEMSEEARHKAAARRAENRTLARVRRDFQREVTAEVDRTPVEQARAFLQLRVDPEATPEQRLDRNLVREMGQSPYGGSWEDVVPRGMQQIGGLHPDAVAELFGFPSGFELVDALVSAPAREQAIADGTEARMLARFGDLEQKRAEEAIQDAAQNDEQMRVLQIEERALARQVGGRPAEQAQVKAAARRLLAARVVKDIRPQAYRDQARRAALAAVEAVAVKDYALAQDHKRSQILNLVLEQESRALRKEIEKGTRAMAKLARGKSTRATIARAAQGEYLRQIDGLLERHGLRKAVAGADLGMTPEKWAQEQEAAGREVVLSDRLRDPRQRAPARELSVADWRDLRDALANMAELARRETTYTRGREKLELQSLEERIVEVIEEQGFRSKEPAGFTESPLERVRATARGLDASLRKAEFVIDALAGNDPNSVLRRVVWEPLRAAQGEYNAKLAAYTEKLSALRAARGEAEVSGWDRQVRETRLKRRGGSAFPVTKWNVIMIALNMGNASNMEKLLKGYRWSQQTVEAVLDAHLDAKDWAFVQGTWDLIDSLWPEVAAMERRLSGVAPPKIEAQTVRTRHGDFRGGYFPVVYDPHRSQLGQKQESSQIVPNASEGFTRASTGHSHTRERTKVAGPLLLSPDVIATHMDQVILDLTHREALIDAQRVLARPGVDGAITKALGREFGFRDFWAPRLRAVARDTADTRGLAAWQRTARWVRQRGSIFKLGFRATTLIMQASGHSNGLRVIQQMGGSSADWMRGVWEGLGGGSPQRMRDTYAQVFDASPFMRDRARSGNQEIRELVRTQSKAGQIKSGVGAFALELIGQVQLRTVDMPIWLAAHRVAVNQGMTEARAVAAADAAVSKSQGGGTKLDQSAFEQNDLLRLITPFYSYSNTVYNQLFRKGNFGAERMADYALFILAPGLYAAAIYALTSGGDVPDPDDPNYEKKVAKALIKAAVGDVAGSVPFIRDVWTVPLGERARGGHPLELFAREGADLLDPKDGTEFMFDVIRSAGLAAGIPTGAPALLVEGLLEEK
jgi:hypothetical protein